MFFSLRVPPPVVLWEKIAAPNKTLARPRGPLRVFSGFLGFSRVFFGKAYAQQNASAPLGMRAFGRVYFAIFRDF